MAVNPMPILSTLLATLFSMFRSRAVLELEHLALRHQIGVLERSARKCPKLTPADRLLWVFFSRFSGGCTDRGPSNLSPGKDAFWIGDSKRHINRGFDVARLR